MFEKIVSIDALDRGCALGLNCVMTVFRRGDEDIPQNEVVPGSVVTYIPLPLSASEVEPPLGIKRTLGVLVREKQAGDPSTFTTILERLGPKPFGEHP